MLLPHVHGTNLENKFKATSDTDLGQCLSEYQKFRDTIASLSRDAPYFVEDAVKALNAYRENAIPILEKRKNSGQENLRSTILEEFFVHLFQDVLEKFHDDSGYYIGKGTSYISLSFAPKNFDDLENDPGLQVTVKDSDFTIGCLFDLSISDIDKTNVSEKKILVPAIAIECKTYIERNMLDSCAGTATQIKKANPYCLYTVAAEFMKLEDSSPELTDIDEVYILCRASNSERLENQKSGNIHPIHADLVRDLNERIRSHLNRLWWDPATALDAGKIIRRP